MCATLLSIKEYPYFVYFFRINFVPALPKFLISAIILGFCRHAGFSYSGPTAAYAYKQIDPSMVNKVFILGPSHHVHLKVGHQSDAIGHASVQF